MSNIEEQLIEFYSQIKCAYGNKNISRKNEKCNLNTRKSRFGEKTDLQGQQPSFLKDSIERARLLAKNSDSKSAITNMYGRFCPINGYKIDDVYPVSDGMVHKISEEQFVDTQTYPTPGVNEDADSLSNADWVWPGKDSYGAKLLSRMGWSRGYCIGRDKTRIAEELELKIKTDRKGLATEQEKCQPHYLTKTKLEVGDKNPVSVLMEYCQKNRLTAPLFTEIEASGPSNMMEFKIAVTVADRTFVSLSACKNKKEARAASALVAVRELDI